VGGGALGGDSIAASNDRKTSDASWGVSTSKSPIVRRLCAIESGAKAEASSGLKCVRIVSNITTHLESHNVLMLVTLPHV